MDASGPASLRVRDCPALPGRRATFFEHEGRNEVIARHVWNKDAETGSMSSHCRQDTRSVQAVPV